MKLSIGRLSIYLAFAGLLLLYAALPYITWPQLEGFGSLSINMFRYNLSDDNMATFDANKTLESKRKLILGWTTFVQQGYDKWPWMLFCPELACDISSDRNLLAAADAVVFYIQDTNWNDLPAVRHSRQRYVFHNFESPARMPILHNMQLEFNWTMTYRRDSDIFQPYGLVLKQPNAQFDLTELLQLVRGKQFSAISIISNCGSVTSKRQEVIDKMNQILQVHKYGNCGDKKCQFTNLTCIRDIGKSYRFYLAFENSLCKDYVTEKLFLRIQDAIVPVVLERVNYKLILPANAYIALDDFNTVEGLSRYLAYLTSNDSAYMEHLYWRKDYVVTQYDAHKSSPDHGLCALCSALHNNQLPQKTLPNIYQWWVGEAKCDM